jgi:hypothetical protein
MRDSDRPLDPNDEKKLKTRGLGAGREYEPFIKVHEISSTGESFRILGRNTTRPHHLLSRLELSAFLVFDRYKTTVEIREQYPLPLIDTLNICARLGMKHPQLSGKLKIVTTDLLIDIKNTSGLAVAVKYADEFEDQRVIEKLQIEKVFWEQQGFQWRLFTEEEITPSIKENLEWLHAANQNSDELYEELSEIDIQLIFKRLNGIDKRLSTTCASLDDEYQCEPGFHIGVFRKAVAANIIDAPLNTVFRQWSCSDLKIAQNLSLLAGGLADVS